MYWTREILLFWNSIPHVISMKWCVYHISVRHRNVLFPFSSNLQIYLFILLSSKKSIKLSESHNKLQYDSKSLDNVSTLSGLDPNDDKGPITQR